MSGYAAAIFNRSAGAGAFGPPAYDGTQVTYTATQPASGSSKTPYVVAAVAALALIGGGVLVWKLV